LPRRRPLPSINGSNDFKIRIIIITLSLGPQVFGLSFQIVARCDGSEDLKFYFGKSSPEVEEAKKAYENPLMAMAHQTQIDRKTAWSKGFIWLAPQGSIQTEWPASPGEFPDWKKDYQLYAILLHEIDMFSAVIISAHDHARKHRILLKVVDSNLSWANYGHDYLFHINQQRMILPPVEQMYDFPGKLGFILTIIRIIRSAEDVFTLLTGRKPIRSDTRAFTLQKSLYEPALVEL